MSEFLISYKELKVVNISGMWIAILLYESINELKYIQIKYIRRRK